MLNVTTHDVVERRNPCWQLTRWCAVLSIQMYRITLHPAPDLSLVNYTICGVPRQLMYRDLKHWHSHFLVSWWVSWQSVLTDFRGLGSSTAVITIQSPDERIDEATNFIGTFNAVNIPSVVTVCRNCCACSETMFSRGLCYRPVLYVSQHFQYGETMRLIVFEFIWLC